MKAGGPEVIKTPVLATEYRRNSNETIELWFVFDEIEPTTSQESAEMRQQWQNVAIGYANAAGLHGGNEPERLVVVGLNEKFNNTYFTIPSEEAEGAFTRELNRTQYTENWFAHMSGHTDDERVSQIAIEMMREEGERTPVDSRNQSG